MYQTKTAVILDVLLIMPRFLLDNRWGNLAATAAAILLDREARAVVLDADPVQGQIKEPMQKIIGLMRSMDYTRTPISKNQYPILDGGLSGRIGQFPYEPPDVFSFFSPLFGPSGAFTDARLLSPEAQILSMNTIGKSLVASLLVGLLPFQPCIPLTQRVCCFDCL